jgi:excisionase family DNA binding protein
MTETIPAIRQWYRVDEAAAILGVSPRQIRNFVDEGTLDARRISNSVSPERVHYRVTKDSIMKLLNDESRRVV